MQIYKLRQRRHMTLIEMIVVMTIIAFVAGLIGINITKAMQEQRFRTEVAMVTDKLRLAQNLMLILNEDVSIQFKKADGGIRYHLNYQCPAQKGWDRELLRAPQILTAIKQIDFEGISDHEKGRTDEFELHFYSTGMVMSQGTLRFSAGRGGSRTDERYVRLYGYPHPITAVTRIEKSSSLPNTQKHKADGLTQHVMPDIISKYQSSKKTK